MEKLTDCLQSLNSVKDLVDRTINNIRFVSKNQDILCNEDILNSLDIDGICQAVSNYQKENYESISKLNHHSRDLLDKAKNSIVSNIETGALIKQLEMVVSNDIHSAHNQKDTVGPFSYGKSGSEPFDYEIMDFTTYMEGEWIETVSNHRFEEISETMGLDSERPVESVYMNSECGIFLSEKNTEIIAKKDKIIVDISGKKSKFELIINIPIFHMLYNNECLITFSIDSKISLYPKFLESIQKGQPQPFVLNDKIKKSYLDIYDPFNKNGIISTKGFLIFISNDKSVLKTLSLLLITTELNQKNSDEILAGGSLVSDSYRKEYPEVGFAQDLCLVEDRYLYVMTSQPNAIVRLELTRVGLIRSSWKYSCDSQSRLTSISADSRCVIFASINDVSGADVKLTLLSTELKELHQITLSKYERSILAMTPFKFEGLHGFITFHQNGSTGIVAVRSKKIYPIGSNINNDFMSPSLYIGKDNRIILCGEQPKVVKLKLRII